MEKFEGSWLILGVGLLLVALQFFIIDPMYWSYSGEATIITTPIFFWVGLALLVYAVYREMR